MSNNIIQFPGASDQRHKHRLVVYELINGLLEAEVNGEFWKADALFVVLGRTTGRGEMLDRVKANAAMAAAKICSALARKQS